MKTYSQLTKDERRLYHLEAWRRYYYRTKPARYAYTIKYQSEHYEQTRAHNRKATLKYKNKTRYSGLRYAVLQRDNNKCVNCDSEKLLTVHHKNGVSWVNSKEPDNRLENLVTLCRSCHTTLHLQLRGCKVSKSVRV